MRPTSLPRATVKTIGTGAAGQAATLISGTLVARMLGVEDRGCLAFLVLPPLIICRSAEGARRRTTRQSGLSTRHRRWCAGFALGFGCWHIKGIRVVPLATNFRHNIRISRAMSYLWTKRREFVSATQHPDYAEPFATSSRA